MITFFLIISLFYNISLFLCLNNVSILFNLFTFDHLILLNIIFL